MLGNLIHPFSSSCKLPVVIQCISVMTYENQVRQKRPIRVLLLCAVDFTAWHFLRPLAKALQKEGFQVTIACGPGEFFEKMKQEGIDIRENPIARSMNVFAHVGELWSTWSLLRSERFDVVHVHTPIAALVGRIAAWAARVPLKIYTAHGFYFHEGMSPLAYKFHVTLERIGALFGDFIMTVSSEDERAALSLGIAKPGKVATIYNGVDVSKFDPALYPPETRSRLRAQLMIPEQAFVIGFVGRLVREKGIFELLEATKRVLQHIPETRLLLVGDTLRSDYDIGKRAFLDAAESLGIKDKLVLPGMVDDTRPYLAIMDVFCLPSYREGMPVSLLEALAMELPCVATQIRGCREEIEDGKSGYLVAPRDPTALAEKLLHIARNPEVAKKLAQNARRRVIEHFNEEVVLAKQIRIYKELLREKQLLAEAPTDGDESPSNDRRRTTH